MKHHLGSSRQESSFPLLYPYYRVNNQKAQVTKNVINLQGLPIRGGECPVHHLLPEAMEPNDFTFFLAWRPCGEAVESDHPGLESRTKLGLWANCLSLWDSVSSSSKGYDNTYGDRVVVWIQWILSHPHSWFSHLLPWGSPFSRERMPPNTSSTCTGPIPASHKRGLGPARGSWRDSSQRRGISKCPI